MAERSGVNWWRSDAADVDTDSSPVVRLISPPGFTRSTALPAVMNIRAQRRYDLATSIDYDDETIADSSSQRIEQRNTTYRPITGANMQ